MNQKTISIDIDEIEENLEESIVNKPDFIEEVRKKISFAVPEYNITIDNNTINITLDNTSQYDHLRNESVGQSITTKVEKEIWERILEKLSKEKPEGKATKNNMNDPIVQVIHTYSGTTSTNFSSPIQDKEEAIASHKEEFNRNPTRIDSEIFILVHKSGIVETLRTGPSNLSD